MSDLMNQWQKDELEKKQQRQLAKLAPVSPNIDALFDEIFVKAKGTPWTLEGKKGYSLFEHRVLVNAVKEAKTQLEALILEAKTEAVKANNQLHAIHHKNLEALLSAARAEEVEMAIAMKGKILIEGEVLEASLFGDDPQDTVVSVSILEERLKALKEKQ